MALLLEGYSEYFQDVWRALKKFGVFFAFEVVFDVNKCLEEIADPVLYHRAYGISED